MKDKLLKVSIVQMIGAALAGAVIYSYNPIATAFYAAVSMYKGMAIIAFPIMGAVMYHIIGGVAAAKYMITLLTISGIVVAIEQLSQTKRNIYINALVAGGVTLLMELADSAMMGGKGIFLNKTTNIEGYIIIGALATLVLCLTIIFSKAIGVILSSNKMSIFGNEEMLSIGLIVACVAYALGDIDIYNFSPMEAFVYFAILVTSYKFGSGIGAITGSGCGLVMSYWNGDASLVGIMCVVGIMSGAFRQLGRLGSLAGAVATIAGVGFLYPNYLFSQEWVSGLIIATVLFAILPSEIMKRTTFGTQKRSEKIPVVIDNNERLRDMAGAFERLSHSFGQVSLKKQEFSYDQVTELVNEIESKHCHNCTRKDQCWNKGKYEAYKETAEMFRIANERGVIYIHDVPKSFATRCRNVNGLVSEVNHLFERARINLLWQNRLIDSKVAVAAQLQEISDIINDFSQEAYNYVKLPEDKEDIIKDKLRTKNLILNKINILENRNEKLEISIDVKTSKGVCVSTKEIEKVVEEVLGKRIRPINNSKMVIGNQYSAISFVEDVNFTVIHGMSKVAKNRASVSGDNFGFTTLNCGQMLMTISDGMGYGQGAYTESETVIELLEQMLESGFKEEVALKLVNLVIMLNSDSGNTATVDMGIVDQYSGMCDFVKLGAAPTFIKRGDWVEVIKSTSLPLGVLDVIDYERVSKKLYDGDFIIMVSDGVIDSLGGEEKEYKLCNIIKNVFSNNPKEFANNIIEAVLEEGGGVANDDMTVLIGAVWSK